MKMKVLYEDDVFPIGKYKGLHVGEVALTDPKYVIWWQSNKTDSCITDEIMDTLVDIEETDKEIQRWM